MWATKILPSLAGIVLSLAASSVSAASIIASSSCPGGIGCDPGVTDNYGFEFVISDTGSPTIFLATLTNTSSTSLSDALIDLLAFNLNPELDLVTGTPGTGEFSITNVAPDWTFIEAGGGIQFMYVGDADTPGDRLGPNDVLSFQFNFGDDQSFLLWTTADDSAGTGIGGGTDSGQVAVSFQQLGADGEDSDLLAAGWEDVPGEVPEPASLALFGLGLAGLGFLRRRRV